ncbi:hypothetical protein ACFO1B_43905 [Dactylosporangium siamense]|uniref:ATP dependent DNA ligase n=1 Tax=Dactylosporangium siamense TaxID=685454 RepID=UPI00361A419D
MGALLLADTDPDGRLQYIGSVGSGLSDAELHYLVQVLTPLRRPTPAAYPGTRPSLRSGLSQPCR